MCSYKIVILLTGTVEVNGTSLTVLQDAEIRKSHYLDAIRYWMKIPAVKVVFVENSNNDLSSFLKLGSSNNKIEFLTFKGNEYNKKLGKGYGELKCLEYAVLNSAFIKDADFVFKVTGRYKVLNFQKFSDFFCKNPEVDLLVDFKLNLTYADSRFFGFRKDFIRDYLIQYENIVNDEQGIIFENILCKAALKSIAEGYNFRPLPYLPRILGISGSMGTIYNTNYFYRIRFSIKQFLKYKTVGMGHFPNI